MNNSTEAELISMAPRLLDLAYYIYASDIKDYTELKMMATNIISDIEFEKIK